MSDDAPSVDDLVLHSATKRTLLILSHAMERAFDSRPRADTTDGPGLVLALFQQREFFDREADRYADLARRGAIVVVGFVGSVEGLPDGVHAVSVAADDPLALDWTLILIGGAYGSALLARDEVQLAEGELSLQASRLFRASWTFRRDRAAAAAGRLLADLARRLPEAPLTAATAIIESGGELVVSEVEAQLSAAADRLVTALNSGDRRAVRMRAELKGLEAIAERDQLTGLRNRHYLEKFLGGADTPAGLGVLLVDVDGLKAVNDRFGHQAGDAVITAVARTIVAALRPSDVVVRWGGDEFVVLAAGLSESNSLALAERLAAVVRAASAEEAWDSLPLSVSIGVAVSARTTLPLEALDRALYSVKRSGKGRAAVAPAAVATG